MAQTTDAAFWDRIAPRYASQPIKDQAAYEYTLGRTASYLSADAEVLEVGCGTGGTAMLLAPKVARYHATDVAPKMIEIARQREGAPEGLTFAANDVLAEPEGSYDAVLALNLLHLVPDVGATLDRLASMVKPGGYFISKSPVLPDGRVPLSLRVMLLAIPVMQWLGRAPFVRFQTASELDRAIIERGFEIIETAHAPVGPPPVRYIVARKLP